MPGTFVSTKIPINPDKPMLGIIQCITDPKTGQVLQVIKAWDRPIRITRVNYDQWGLGGSYNAFYKLVRAGFVKARRITPEVLEILPDSLVTHVKNCEVPGYWNKSRIERYREAAYDVLRLPPTPRELEKRAKRKKWRKWRPSSDSQLKLW